MRLRDGLPALAVLVVDDNATNRRILEEVLRAWRMVPTLVESGPGALMLNCEQPRPGGAVRGRAARSHDARDGRRGTRPADPA